ncbi:hypothetical protein BJ170DRAFT_351101 [Xylariales sp. AK1849]|nr:hypothetical protein BJ170DRAFT_351101 [Xylariales sp. AK1849]
MPPSNRLSRLLPFSSSTTPLQATTYLLGISLFSISFLVFLNSAVSFVITDLIGIKRSVGDIVGTLGFVDELVALVACPVWGLVSDRLGVRWVAVIGYTVIGIALFCFVQARDVWPGLILARIGFAIGATAAATMVTAILPVLTDDGEDMEDKGRGRKPNGSSQRDSVAISMESDVTITPERFSRSASTGRASDAESDQEDDHATRDNGRKPSVLAGYVGLFTGCGALVALVLFLPLPAQFSKREGVTLAEAVTYSFYVVGAIAFFVAVFVFFGLQGLKGEEDKGWRMLLGLRRKEMTLDPDANNPSFPTSDEARSVYKPVPYHHLLLSSLRLGATDPYITIGYLGGFVARASTVAISLFIPLYVNAFFIRNGFCQGSPNDPSPELKKECRAAYVLASILTGVAQLVALLCAPVFGYLSSRRWKGVNVPVLVATICGVVGYIIFPMLESPEYKDIDGRGGQGIVFLVVALLGISQIGAIVCSLGSLGQGVLSADLPTAVPRLEAEDPSREAGETAPLLEHADVFGGSEKAISRVQLKGSVAGVYSWCGGAAILLLTKLGGWLFDVSSTGAPFYMMAVFNGILLFASLGIDLGRGVRARGRSER